MSTRPLCARSAVLTSRRRSVQIADFLQDATGLERGAPALAAHLRAGLTDAPREHAPVQDAVCELPVHLVAAVIRCLGATQHLGAALEHGTFQLQRAIVHTLVGTDRTDSIVDNPPTPSQDCKLQPLQLRRLHLIAHSDDSPDNDAPTVESLSEPALAALFAHVADAPPLTSVRLEGLALGEQYTSVALRAIAAHSGLTELRLRLPGLTAARDGPKALADALMSCSQLRSLSCVERPSGGNQLHGLYGRVYQVCQCPDLLADALPHLPHLTHLELGSVPQASPVAGALARLRALQSLELGDLGEPCPTELRCLTRLRCTPQRDREQLVLGSLALCSALRCLELPDTHDVEHIDFAALASLQHLSVFELGDGNAFEADINEFEGGASHESGSGGADSESDGQCETGSEGNRDGVAATGVGNACTAGESSADSDPETDRSSPVGTAETAVTHGVRALVHLTALTYLRIGTTDPRGPAANFAHHVAAAVARMPHLQALHLPLLRADGLSDEYAGVERLPEALAHPLALRDLSCCWQTEYSCGLGGSQNCTGLQRLSLTLMHCRDVDDWRQIEKASAHERDSADADMDLLWFDDRKQTWEQCSNGLVNSFTAMHALRVRSMAKSLRSVCLPSPFGRPLLLWKYTEHIMSS